MRAARCEEYGGPENVVIRDIPGPEVTAGHVLVGGAGRDLPRPALHRQQVPGVRRAAVPPRRRVRRPGRGGGGGRDRAVGRRPGLWLRLSAGAGPTGGG